MMKISYKPFQERVIEEKDELADKIQKLAAFIAGHVFPMLSDDEQARLFEQYDVMQTYLNILKVRIAHFTGPNGEKIEAE